MTRFFRLSNIQSPDLVGCNPRICQVWKKQLENNITLFLFDCAHEGLKGCHGHGFGFIVALQVPALKYVNCAFPIEQLSTV